MNSVTMKYNKLLSSSAGFKGSLHTVQEDIIALFATKHRTKRKRDANEDDNNELSKKNPNRDLPPFILYWKDASTGEVYKLGDSKKHNRKTFYF